MENLHKEILDGIVKDLKIYTTELDALKKQQAEIFNKPIDALEKDFIDKNINLIFKAAIINNDVMTLYRKVSAYIEVFEALKLEIDFDILSEINGLVEFVTKNDPFYVDYFIVDGKLAVKNKKELDSKRSFFVKNFDKLSNLEVNDED